VVWSEFEQEALNKISDETRKVYGYAPDLNKATMFISDVLAKAWGKQMRSASLEKACNAIIDFAKDR
jgi:hypothetical protein